MPLDLPPDAGKVWLPPRPAIQRPAEHVLLRPGAFRPCTREERRAIVADLVRTKRLTPEQARCAMLLTPVIPLRPASAAPSTATYIGSNVKSGSGTSFSWTGVTMGAGYQYLAVGFGVANGSANSAYVNSCTVDGTAATQLGSGVVVSNGGASWWIVAKSVASGTIAVTTSASIALGGGAPYPISYHLYGITGLLSTTPLGTPSSGSGASIPLSLSSSSADGFVLLCGGRQDYGTLSISGNITSFDYTLSNVLFWSAHKNAQASFAATVSDSGGVSTGYAVALR